MNQKVHLLQRGVKTNPRVEVRVLIALKPKVKRNFLTGRKKKGNRSIVKSIEAELQRVHEVENTEAIPLKVLEAETIEVELLIVPGIGNVEVILLRVHEPEKIEAEVQAALEVERIEAKDRTAPVLRGTDILPKGMVFEDLGQSVNEKRYMGQKVHFHINNNYNKI